MPLPLHLALVPEGVDVNQSDLTRVSAALSKQVQRDFMPIWEVDATVDSYLKLEDVPTDYWPIIVMKDVQGAAGYHEDKDGQPFAVVQFGDDWSLTASHECLEMLADPFGTKLQAGQLLDQAVQLGQTARRVRYLVEVCDPSESGQFSYQVNGIQVSDFLTPNFYDPVCAAGVRYSYTGAIDGPRKVLDGGYISWEDPVAGHWYQVRMFPDDISRDVPHLVDLSSQTRFEEFRTPQNLRAAVDRVTKPPAYREGLRGQMLMAARVGTDTSVKAQASRADSLRKQLKDLVAQSSKPARHPRAKKGKGT